ncbi:MAG TPA: hypothetical protein VGS19_20965 [Streptosporangiaceae bacterium]|nr:hypothetical protein [Streptosporangiaceae bacterium]
MSRTADPALRVLVVWVPFMGASRGSINPSVFPDSRVTTFWDQNAVSSQWFSQHVTNSGGPTWDYYLLFSPTARWGAVPGPVLSQGGTVLGTSAQLLSAIRPLLR